MTTLILLLLSGIPAALTVTHTLKYFYTASSGVPSFPTYVSVGLVDDVQISYCDSRINENIPKQEWMKNVSLEFPNYWKEETWTCQEKQETFQKNIDTAKQRFNHIGGMHVYQQMYGCEWDDETGEIRDSYDQFGYDGEDLIILDPRTQQWIAPKPQAVETIQKWDHDGDAVEHEKIYLTQTCVGWLKKYLDYGRSSLTRTDRPSVYFLQKTYSSVVSCHATGFYPNRAEMFWRKDGEEIYGLEKGEILPNNDGTFQMSAHVDLSSVPPKDWNKYECVFQFSGVKEDMTHRLEKTKILTNKSNTNYLISVGALAALCVFAFIGAISVIGFIGRVGFLLLNKCKGRKPADSMTSRSETSSLASNSSVDTKGISSSDKPLLHKQNPNK